MDDSQQNIAQAAEAVDPEIAGLMARFESTARAHPNFGKGERRPARENCRTTPRHAPLATLPAASLPEVRCARGMPPERDEDLDPPAGGGRQVVGSSEAEFHAAVDVKEADRVLYAFFEAHYGVWIPMVELSRISGCHAVHSRIPEVRWMLPRDHDIDQKSIFYEPTGKAHSHYRLCLKSESQRLKRQAEREMDKGQREFEQEQAEGAEV